LPKTDDLTNGLGDGTDCQYQGERKRRTALSYPVVSLP